MTSPAPRFSGISSAHAPELDLPARFIALAMICLAVAAVASPFMLPLLVNGYGAPRALAFVHLNTLGVIATIIVGASYQLVPVVLQTPLVSARLGRLSFWIHVAGLALFLPGFWLSWLPGIGIGGSLVFSGLLLYVGLTGLTLRRAPHQDVVSWHIAAALAGLAGGIAIGLLLALNEGTGFLGTFTPRLLAGHITLMFGGWIAVMLSGVSYRLAGMFTLAEDRIWHHVAWVELALSVTGAWGLALGLVLGAGRPILLLAALTLLTAQALFASQLGHLYHVRRRRGADVHIPFALVAAAAGVTSAGLLTGGLVAGASPGSPIWIAVVWLALAGMAETAIQGFLYKIATFLVWLQRYAPLAGRRKVPKLEDMFGMRMAQVGCAFWTTGLALAVAGILSGESLVCSFAGLLDGLGLTLFVLNVARIATHWQPNMSGRIRSTLRVGRPGVRQEGRNP